MSGGTPTGAKPNGSTALLDQVRRVARLRADSRRYAEQLAQRRAGWEDANAGLISLASEFKNKLAEEELRLRDMAVAEFKSTGDKKPAPGVTVSQKVDLVYSEAQAFAWAREKNMALALDLKAFEAIAKASELAFVTKVDTAAASLSRNLEAALTGAGVSLQQGTPGPESESAELEPSEEGAAF